MDDPGKTGIGAVRGWSRWKGNVAGILRMCSCIELINQELARWSGVRPWVVNTRRVTMYCNAILIRRCTLMVGGGSDNTIILMVVVSL